VSSRFHRLDLARLSTFAVVVALGAMASCAKVSQINVDGSGGGPGNGTGGRFGGGSGGAIALACIGKCTDFPAAAILDTGVSGDPSGMFSGTPPTANGPCITEPEDGTLFPNNWLRPRVKFTKAAGKMAQIRLHAANQQNDLVAYTTADTWIVPAQVWGGLRAHQTADAVTVTVWVQGAGSSASKFTTAPVGAGGSLVFWAAKATEVDKNLDTECPKDATGQPALSCYMNDSQLMGFKVGDEKAIPVLTIPQIVQPSKDNNNKTSHVRCIGCHTGTPDGNFVAFNDAWPWRGVMAGISPTNVGTVPPYVTTGGTETLWQPALGVMTFTKLHWSDTDRTAVTSYSLSTPNQGDWFNAPKSARPNLAWFDLASPAVPLTNGNFSGDPANPTQIFPLMGTNMGIIARTGDSRGGTTPNWGHVDDTIVYTSTDAALDGRLDNQPVPNPNPNNETHNVGHADIWKVPFNNRAGGVATPLAGADTTTFEEYFPSFSPDDRLVAFNRVPVSQPMYANPNSEIAVIPAAGGKATVLRANQPPACTGKTSPGVNNHWAKWSPDVKPGSEGTYYWVVFSSNRTDIAPVQSQHGARRLINISQLYVAPILVGELDAITTFPAIYLWNQPTDSVNTTPAWESFQLPPVE
jgi:hypothetical protein